MKLNIANPFLGAMKVIEIDDEKKLATLYDMRMAQEVEGDNFGEEFAGYVFRITGGNDKQGFPMMQGVLTNGRVKLLLNERSKGFRAKRAGDRRRRSVRGCIVGPDISILNLSIVKQGETPIEGLTDEASEMPRRRGPKRANNIRKLLNLEKDDDVTKFVIRREFTKNGRVISKAPKIQRLITPMRLQRKAQYKKERKAAMERSRQARAEYKALLKARETARRESAMKKRSSRKSSKKE